MQMMSKVGRCEDKTNPRWMMGVK